MAVAVLRPFPAAASVPRPASPMALAANSPPGGLRMVNLSSKFKGLRVGARTVTAKRRSARRVGVVVCEASNTAVDVIDITKDTWESSVLGSDVPVIVEFWAPWCGPCKLIHPIIDELAKDYAGKMKVYRLNTDENPDTATKYGVRSIPTVLLFKSAERKDSIIGAVPKSTLVACIDKYL